MTVRRWICGLAALSLAAALGLSAAVRAAQPPTKPPPAAPAPAAAPATPTPAPVASDPRRFGLAEPIAKPAGAIRLATYNLENFYDVTRDPRIPDKYDNPTKPQPQRKALAAAIHKINADILCVEEVESYDTLLHFRDAFLPDMGYQYIASIDAGDDRGIEQALLSRFPISDVKNWPHLPLGGVHPDKYGRGPNENAGKPITYHRSPLRVTVTIGEAGAREGGPAVEGQKAPELPAQPTTSPHPYTLTLFVVHQKSGKDGEYWREKESAKTVELVAELQKANPDTNIAILGDFNATLDAPSMRIFTDAGLLDAFKDAKPKDPATTSHESGRTLDHILMNPALWHEFIPQTHFILGTPARPAGPNWSAYAPPEGYASDHYPVVVDLTPLDR